MNEMWWESSIRIISTSSSMRWVNECCRHQRVSHNTSVVMSMMSTAYCVADHRWVSASDTQYARSRHVFTCELYHVCSKIMHWCRQLECVNEWHNTNYEWLSTLMYETSSCYDNANDDNITNYEWCDDMNTFRVNVRSDNEWHVDDDASTTEWKVAMWTSDACWYRVKRWW
jgi:hypothetical protein